jgi:hypothetical protein
MTTLHLTSQLERLSAHYEWLQLYQVATELTTVLEQAAKKDSSYADFLDNVLTREVKAKQEKHQTASPLLGYRRVDCGARTGGLAVALGMSTCVLRLWTMFTTAGRLITTLGKALYKNRLRGAAQRAAQSADGSRSC